MNSVTPLIRKAKQSDLESLGELLNRYEAFVTAYVKRRVASLRPRVGPADVVQEANANVCRGFSFEGDSEAEFTAWYLKITDHVIINLFRKHGAQIRDLAKDRRMYDDTGSASVGWYEPAGNATTPSQKLMKGEAALQLMACISELPADQQEAIQLRHLDGYSTQEICDAMNKTPASVAGLLQRGLRKLRELLSKDVSL